MKINNLEIKDGYDASFTKIIKEALVGHNGEKCYRYRELTKK